MEGWRGDAALTHVRLTLACDEPFPEQDLHAALRAILDEMLRLVDQDFDEAWLSRKGLFKPTERVFVAAQPLKRDADIAGTAPPAGLLWAIPPKTKAC